MMIDINREKLKKIMKRGLAFVLVIGLAASYRVVNPGSSAQQTAGTLEGVTNWGLSFDKNGDPPIGNATAEELVQYDSWYVGNTSKKTIYLTFDGGYENGYTGEILDTLKEHDVPAAFFLVGTYIRDNPELVKRMAAEGHTVGNHSMHHPDMSAIAEKAAFQEELAKVEAEYKDVVGAAMPKYYRPPQGKFSKANLEMAKALGYRTIFWSLAYVDWNVDQQPTREEALNTLLPRTHNGAVILLHSTSKTNAKVLGELIEKWKAEGYQFGTLDDLTKDVK